MASEGGSGIDFARERLAAARAQKSKASKMIDAADEMAEAAQRLAQAAKAMAKAAKKKNKEAKKMETTAKENKKDAQSILQRSQGEVEDAEAFLKEALKQRDSIGLVDSNGEEKEKADLKNEKRKEAPEAIAADGEKKETAGLKNKKRKGAPKAAAARALSAGDIVDVEEIAVQGAGTPEVNGTYKRCRMDGSHDVLPSFPYDGKFPVYSRRGSWEGGEVNFFSLPVNLRRLVHRLPSQKPQ